jgi:hypothetical protein
VSTGGGNAGGSSGMSGDRGGAGATGIAGQAGSADQDPSSSGCGCKISSTSRHHATATLLLVGIAGVVRRRRSKPSGEHERD